MESWFRAVQLLVVVPKEQILVEHVKTSGRER